MLCFDRFRDPLVGNRKQDKHSPVLFRCADQTAEFGFFAGNGIDQGPARIDPERGLQDFRKAGVDAERQVRYHSQFVDHIGHCPLLVDSACPAVHVEYGGAGLLLLSRHFPHKIEPPFPKFFLQLFLSGGINPFHDHLKALSGYDLRYFSFGAEYPPFFRFYRKRLYPVQLPDEGSDMLRRRTAAAPDYPGAGPDQVQAAFREYFRRHPVNRPIALQLGNPRIGLYDDRNLRVGIKALRQLFHPVGTRGAVQPDGVRSQPLQGDGHAFRRGSEQGPSVRFKCQRRHHRQITDLARGDDGCPRFLQAHHRLHNQKVHPGLAERPDLLFIDVHQFLKLHAADRAELSSGHRDVAGDKSPAGGSLPGESHKGSIHLRKPVLETIFLKLDPVGAESRGVQNIASRLRESLLQTKQRIRMLQNPELRTYPRRHARLLQIRPGSTVKK